jgi:hypothetical protein
MDRPESKSKTSGRIRDKGERSSIAGEFEIEQSKRLKKLRIRDSVVRSFL